MRRTKLSPTIVCITLFVCLTFLVGSAFAAVVRPPKSPPKSPKQELGDLIFNDTTLSNPPGVSCATCHDPFIFWADPRKTPTSAGNLGISGDRNAPQMSYAAFSPFFHKTVALGWVGGQFWDGRAKDLVEQAKRPFLNPIEMNATPAYVVNQIKIGPYAALFKEVYGPGAFLNVTAAYNKVADAVAAYVGQAEFFNFNSKYDYYLSGQLQLSPSETRGLALFEANCASCHPNRPATPGEPVVFTTFAYANLGLPTNANAPAPPIGGDLGLGKVVNDPLQDGKFKIPTLRNIAYTGPYGHNGLFPTVRGMVNFLNKRNVQVPVNVPEVPRNVDTNVGNFGFTTADVTDIIAFLNTLTDGYVFINPIVLSPAEAP